MVGKFPECRRGNPQADAASRSQSTASPAPAQAWRCQCRARSGSHQIRMIARTAVAEAFVGLGANLDNPLQQVTQAIAELDAIECTRVLAASSLYRSAPVGYADQPDFINAVAKLQTGLSPRRLLDALHVIENRHGRRRSVRNAPRTLDLDLLLYGAQIGRAHV